MRSAIICACIALLAVVIFGFLKHDANAQPDLQAYVSVGTSTFSVCVITYLFWLLYEYEKKPDEEFGNIIRINSATLIVALLISVINSGYDLLLRFSG